MNITLEQNGVSALVTVKLEQGDYQDAVKKARISQRKLKCLVSVLARFLLV